MSGESSPSGITASNCAVEPGSAPQLTAHAADGTTISILRDAVELFVAKDRHSSSEKRQFTELASRFLEGADASDRRYVASLLAGRPDAPREVIARLALDDAAIAAPVLAKSPVLTQTDLAEIARDTDFNHRMIIAKRDDLTLDVVEGLLCDDDGRVMELLVKNGTAPLPQKARDKVVANAADLPEQTAVLANRTDTDAATLARLFLHLDTNARARALVVCEARATLEAALPGAAAPEPVVDTAAIAELERLALHQDEGGFISKLTEVSGLSSDAVAGIIADGEGEPLVLLLTALGMTTSAIVRVILLAVPHLGSDYAVVKRLTDFRRGLNPRTARFICSEWVHFNKAGSARPADAKSTTDPLPAAAIRRDTPLADRRDNAIATPQIPQPIAQSRSRATLFGRRRYG